MSDQLIRFLHVEDDLSQRRYVAHHLKGMPGYRFEVRYADGEDAALSEFRAYPVDLVILDYQLTQGDGLSCLNRLREVDRIVPIIAISGVASPETAAELLQAGADDYISKEDLTSQTLRANLQPILSRATACRSRILAGRSGENP